MVHDGNSEWQVLHSSLYQHSIYWWNALPNFYVTVSFIYTNETRKERDIKKLQPLGDCEMQNM